MKIVYFLIAATLSLCAHAVDLVVEDQVRLCESDTSIISKLNLKNDFKAFDVFYLETDNRDFQKNKISLRLRVKEKKVEITVKRRISNPGDIQETSDMECEYDLHGGTKEYSCKIDSNISFSDFNQILKGRKNWSDFLSSNQTELINIVKSKFNEVKLFGYLNAVRFEIEDSSLGAVTIDLIHPAKDPKISYHEISIRYKLSEMNQMNKLFNNFISSNKLLPCKNQLDWSVDKFSVMDKVN